MKIMKGSFLVALALLNIGCDREKSDPLVYQQQAVEAYVSGDYQESLINLKVALKSDPTNSDMRKLMGEVWLKLGDPTACVEQLLKSKNLGMENNELILPLAECHLYQGDFDEILSLEYMGHQYNVSSQDHAELFALKAQASIAQNNSTLALDYLDQAIALAPDMPEVILAQAHWLTYQQKYEQALEVLTSLNKQYQKYAKAWGLAADLHRFQNHLKPSEEAYTQAILYADNQLDLINYYLYRALVRTYLQEFGEASEDLQRITTLNPNHPAASYLNGLISLSSHKYEQAILSFQKVLARQDTFIYGHYFIGLSYTLIKNYHSARDHLVRFTKALPKHALGQKLLALVEIQLFELNQAKSRLNDLLKNNPDDADLYHLLGEIHLKDGDIEKGAEYLEKALKLDPERLDTQLKLGMAHIDMQDSEAARWAFDKVLSQMPNYKKALLLKFINEYRTKHYQLAMNLAKTYARFNPKEPLGYSLQGLVHLIEGAESEAIQSFEDALKRDPHDANANTQLASIALKDGDVSKSKNYLQTILERYQHVPSMLKLAKLHLSAKERSEAKTLLKRVIKEDPNILSAHLVLTRLSIEEGQLDRAVGYLRSVPEALRKDQSFLAVKGLVELAQHQTQLAENTLSTIMKQGGNLNKVTLEFGLTLKLRNKEWADVEKYSDALFKLSQKGIWIRLKSQALYEQNKKEQSLQLLETWLRTHQNDTPTQLLFANYLMRQKVYDKAYTVYTALLVSNPDSPIILNNIAWILKDKSPADAKYYVEKALALSPGWDSALDTLNQIEQRLKSDIETS